MLFSEVYGISKTEDDTWFDPVLEVDTRLFIDPFLLFIQNDGFFSNAHRKIVDFFNAAFETAMECTDTKRGVAYKKLGSMLMFPEVDELCLGYTTESTRGAGSNAGFATALANSIILCVKAGLTGFEHYEEIAIFEEGIGADRISDICANILKDDLIAYTQSVCQRHNIPLVQCRIRNSSFDFRFKRWQNGEVALPWNPVSERPVLLVPQTTLRDLPSINPDDFLNWAWNNENETLRNDFNYEIKSNIRKEDIVRIARERVDLVQRYVDFRENRGSSPYNLTLDVNGVYVWHEATKEFQSTHPITLDQPNSHEEFERFLASLIDIFRTYVEDNSGYKLLWNDNPKRPKKEESVQLLFLGIVKHYCSANNIDISREANIGRGPVDFKFSSGYVNRALLEVKRAGNSKLLQGIRKQLPQYLRSENVRLGHYLVITQNDKDMEKVDGLHELAEEIGKAHGAKIVVTIVDGRDQQPSASHQ